MSIDGVHTGSRLRMGAGTRHALRHGAVMGCGICASSQSIRKCRCRGILTLDGPMWDKRPDNAQCRRSAQVDTSRRARDRRVALSPRPVNRLHLRYGAIAVATRQIVKLLMTSWTVLGHQPALTLRDPMRVDGSRSDYCKLRRCQSV
jgi:hypothetical protein